MVRKFPNIVVTGTPGTGKSTLSSMLTSSITYESYASQGGIDYSSHLQHINVSSLVRTRKDLQVSFDEEWDAYEIDEDKLVDELEKLSGGRAPEPDGEEDGGSSLSGTDEGDGGLIFDWHSNEVWPERWVDLVVVLRTDNKVLWDRLEKRGYTQQKIQENNQSEIMQTVLEEARGAYSEEAIVELQSNTSEQLEENAERIIQWIGSWRKQRGLE